MTSGPGPWRRLRSHRRLRPARAKVLGSKASTEPSFAFLSARSSHASISRNDHRGTCTWATENRRRFSKVLVLQVSPRARPSCAEPTFLSCSRTAMRCAYPTARLLQPPRRHLMRCRPILPCGKTPHRRSAASLRRDHWRGRRSACRTRKEVPLDSNIVRRSVATGDHLLCRRARVERSICCFAKSRRFVELRATGSPPHTLTVKGLLAAEQLQKNRRKRRRRVS